MPRMTPVPWRKLVCVFEKEGFVVVRQESSHIILTKAGCKRPVVIPQYRQVPVFIIKNNLRTASMSRERYFELLEQC